MNKPSQVQPAESPGGTESRPGDSAPSGWVDRAPAGLRPYFRLMRLDRPIGIWLLFWPCVFGLILGAVADHRIFPNALSVILMALGAVLMRGAGCTYNDIVDRDFDAQV